MQFLFNIYIRTIKIKSLLQIVTLKCNKMSNNLFMFCRTLILFRFVLMKGKNVFKLYFFFNVNK